MQYFTVLPQEATAGSPPNSTRVQNMVRGDDEAEIYVEELLELLRTGKSSGETSRLVYGQVGWTLLYTGGVGDDEDGWISHCEFIEQKYPGIHQRLGVRIVFTDGPYGKRMGVIQ